MRRLTISFACLALLFARAHALPLAPADTSRRADANAGANAEAWQTLRPQLAAGLELLFAMKFSEAAAAFDAAIARYPADPHPRLLRSQLHLWRFLFDYSAPDYAKFMATSDKTIALAEAALDANAANSRARLALGLSYGFRAIANLRAENVVKGVLDARSCYNALTEVLKQDPAQYDAYLGMGIFHFMLGAIPKNTRWVANLSGLKGDCALGLRELKLAAEKAPFVSNNAKLMLGIVNVYYNKDYAAGLAYLNELAARYPKSVPVLYTLGNAQAQIKKLNYALEYFARARQAADTNFKTFAQFTEYRMGEIYFRLGDFARAKPHLQAFLKGRPERSFRVNAIFRLALIEELEGRRDNAVKGYRKALEPTALEAEDRYAARKCKEYLAAPLDSVQKRLWLGANCAEASKTREAEELLQPIAGNAALSKELRAEAAYFLGEAFRRAERAEAAFAWYARALALQPEREKWLLAWSYFQMAEIRHNAGNTEAARALVEKARAFSGYDFEEWLAFALERDATMLK